MEHDYRNSWFSHQKMVGSFHIFFGLPEDTNSCLSWGPILFRGLIRTRRKNLALRAFRVKMLETGARNAKRLWVVGGGNCQEMLQKMWNIRRKTLASLNEKMWKTNESLGKWCTKSQGKTESLEEYELNSWCGTNLVLNLKILKELEK